MIVEILGILNYYIALELIDGFYSYLFGLNEFQKYSSSLRICNFYDYTEFMLSKKLNIKRVFSN